MNDDFLEKYRIEFPSVHSLAILLAEPVSLIPTAGYTFSDGALQIIGDLVAPSKMGPTQYNKWIAADDDPNHYQISFFLDGPYHLAHHIWAIRDGIDQIAMTSYLGPEAQQNTAEDPPPVGLLYVADVPTLADLAERSPFLGQLLPVADGPPDDAIWSYFLGKAEQVEIENSEDVEVPIENGIKILDIEALMGEPV